MKHWLAISLALASASMTSLVVAGCSDEDDDKHGSAASGGHTSPYPSCNAITTACHEVDVGEGPIHDCHDQGHGATSDADCAPIKDQCIALCNAAKADAGGEGGGGDGGGGGGGDGGGD